MIKGLKIKFIILAMVSLFLSLAIIIVGMNIMSYNSVVQDADAILDFLAENRGTFPDKYPDFRGKMPDRFTRETPYESRYFTVLLNAESGKVQVNTSKIASVDSDSAMEYVKEVLEDASETGFVDNYRYRVVVEPATLRITFLDCSAKLHSFYQFLYSSIFMALGGFVVLFFVIFFVSGIILRPVAESYEKQRRFITDAGHEIKTPLTIIQADADVMEMDIGENEWLQDIRLQAKRLAGLTNDLIYLSRMEETASKLEKVPFSISQLMEEVTHSFQSLAQTQQKTLHCNVQPELFMEGDQKTIGQLMTILLDNAMKYSPIGGIVAVNGHRQGKYIRISVINTTEAPVEREKLGEIFDRFYRMESSRSTQTGGYGIGLALAQAIVSAHGGKIYALSPEPHTMEILLQFSACN